MKGLLQNGRFELGAMIYNPEKDYDLEGSKMKVLLDFVDIDSRNREKLRNMKSEFDKLIRLFRRGERDSTSNQIIRLGVN